MVKEILKRDGRREAFDPGKIVSAIQKAMIRTGTVADDVALRIASNIANKDQESLSVEEVQDMVEKGLMSSRCKDAAKEYITYRSQRNQERARNSEIGKELMRSMKGSGDNQNANVDDASFGGRKYEMANVLTKELALSMCLRPEVAKAYLDRMIYPHDFSEYILGDHNCLFANIQRLLKSGFRTRNGGVRPAQSFATACQLLAVIFQVQSQEQFGGVASCHIDYDLAPYVEKSLVKKIKAGLKYVGRLSDDEVLGFVETHSDLKDMCDAVEKEYPEAWNYALDMLEEEGNQAAQSLYHNLNTLESRAGSQIPFTSLNFGTDTSWAGRKVMDWLLNASLDGIGKDHHTPIFPISIFKYKKGVNAHPGDPNYDLKKKAIKSLTHRIYPNWVNCDCPWNVETPGDPDTEMATMGCRTMLGYDRHGLGYSKVGRGNICPTTINLPKLGIKHGICLGERDKPDIEGFWKEFDEVLKLTETCLRDRYFYICSQSVDSGKFMYYNGTIADADKAVAHGVAEAMKHGSLAVGYIGVAEMCQAMFGKDHSEDQDVYDFALSVVKHISDFCAEASERNNLNFSCYATPAENLCKTLATALREQYGVIPKVTDRKYITNSHHVPVWQKVSINRKLELEAPFCKYPTGGCITYVELDSSVVHNEVAVEQIIDYAMSLNIPYLALNFPLDTCLDCGYQGEINEFCPKCGSNNIQHLRRVTGYLSSDYRNFNEGKVAEVLDRVKHSLFTDFSGMLLEDK